MSERPTRADFVRELAASVLREVVRSTRAVDRSYRDDAAYSAREAAFALAMILPDECFALPPPADAGARIAELEAHVRDVLAREAAAQRQLLELTTAYAKLRDELHRARDLEREACAAICEGFAANTFAPPDAVVPVRALVHKAFAAQYLATAIRARGGAPPTT